MGYRMVETKNISMQTEPAQRVIAIAILHVTTHGMSHIGRMHANLVLAPSLQLELNQRMLSRTIEYMKMRNGVFTSIVYIAAISDIGLIVFQPIGDGALIFSHFTGKNGNVSAVVHRLMPIGL